MYPRRCRCDSIYGAAVEAIAPHKEEGGHTVYTPEHMAIASACIVVGFIIAAIAALFIDEHDKRDRWVVRFLTGAIIFVMIAAMFFSQASKS